MDCSDQLTYKKNLARPFGTHIVFFQCTSFYIFSQKFAICNIYTHAHNDHY